MIQPTVRGRKLPLNDWEGDDPAPVTNRTCMDSASGRMLAFATNGFVTLDGKTIRAAVHPHDTDGITMDQASAAIFALTARTIVQHHGWLIANVKTHLRYARGLIVIGMYSAIPREYRHQAGADFAHAMWVSHISAASGNARLWDPLNPAIHEYGRWVPASVIWGFLDSLGNQCGYIPLEPL
jgi:hypothetical protein